MSLVDSVHAIIELSQPMKILRRDFDITTFGAVLLFLCRAPFLSVRGEFSRCSDFSEAGRLVDGMYNLEVMPDIAISVYCKGMKSGNPTEYIDLPEENFANHYYEPMGAPVVWGITQFTRIRIDLDTWLVQADDWTFSTFQGRAGGANISYGHAGNGFCHRGNSTCQGGNFSINLMSTPFEVDPGVTWTWSKGMKNSTANEIYIIDSSNPRQMVQGRCEKSCFPVLCDESNPRLKLRLVTNNPCVNRSSSLCQNYGKCLLMSLLAYECLCAQGWTGPDCSIPEGDRRVDGELSLPSDNATSFATCPQGYTLTRCQCSIVDCDGVMLPTNGEEKCTAYTSGIPVRAVATCTKFDPEMISTTVTRVPEKDFSERAIVTYTCPKGSVLIACNWHSPWLSGDRPVSNGLGTFAGNKCSVNCGQQEKRCALYARCLTLKCLCENGGTCSESLSCSCPRGYVGKFCEKIDYCAWNVKAIARNLCNQSGSCSTKPAVPTYGRHGNGSFCRFPMPWNEESHSNGIFDCAIGPPFACFLHTNGSDGYVDLGSWNPGIVYTLEAWIQPTLSVLGRSIIIGDVTDSCNDWGLFLQNNSFGLLYAPLAGDNNCSVSLTSELIVHVSQWHHVAITGDGTFVRLFVNGTEILEAKTTKAFLGNARRFRIGGNCSCCPKWNGFSGNVKNVLAWKRVLSENELKDHYKSPVKYFNTTEHVLHNHLVAHYEFGDNPPQVCYGFDWKFQDWLPADGAVVFGVHCNVRKFYIQRGFTVKVAPWSRRGASNLEAHGTFQVYAENVVIKGVLTATGAGYEGGARPTISSFFGNQGESITSLGRMNSSQNRGGGGGGYGEPPLKVLDNHGKPGGGGGYGEEGKSGSDKKKGRAGLPGSGGAVYGSLQLSLLHMGSGGGSGGNDNSVEVDTPPGGRGGSGGGAIQLEARRIIEVTGEIRADGLPGQGEDVISCSAATCNANLPWICWPWSGPGGGGAGGSIYLRAPTVDIGVGQVTAVGGQGGYGAVGCGGDGGAGRIRIDSDVLQGTTQPAPSRYRLSGTFIDLAMLPRESVFLSDNTSDHSVYLGCFEDFSSLNRLLKIRVASSNEMTTEYCRRQFYGRGFKYYGVEFSTICFCDNVLNESHSRRFDNRECNCTCSGNASLTCGGLWRISVYGPIPRRAAVAATFQAHRTCTPLCDLDFSKKANQSFYGFCSDPALISRISCSAGFLGDKFQHSASSCPEIRENATGTNSSSDKVLSSWTQIFVPVVVTAALLALIGFTFVIYRYGRIKKRRRQRVLRANFYVDSYNPPAIALGHCTQIGRDSWEISPKNLVLLEKLGEGFFGVVLKGELAKPVTTIRGIRTHRKIVACKMLKPSGTFKEHIQLLDEISLMKRIGQHSHIVSITGCITVENPVCLVIEFCSGGDLLAYLRNSQFRFSQFLHKSNKTNIIETVSGDSMKETGSGDCSDPVTDCSEKERCLDQGDFLSFAWQIASGMEYLLGKDFVHRDLACRNVLLTSDGMLKVSDFGLTRSVYLDGAYTSKSSQLLPLRWMAPEAIKYRTFSEFTDVWSFGVCLWEICTLGAYPYPAIANEDLLRELLNGTRLEKPQHCTDKLFDIMCQCWNKKPESRPSFKSLTKRLSLLLESEVPQKYIELECAGGDSDENSDVESDQTWSPQSDAKSSQADTAVFEESRL
ncbi:uncharacterized protein [Oscarella lobularis]|uniref:uncharacterized protein isoform X3 n=1 Tax=Oscarella lobularis TaxID=121494 RepID=UPI0033134C2A